MLLCEGCRGYFGLGWRFSTYTGDGMVFLDWDGRRVWGVFDGVLAGPRCRLSFDFIAFSFQLSASFLRFWTAAAGVRLSSHFLSFCGFPACSATMVFTFAEQGDRTGLSGLVIARDGVSGQSRLGNISTLVQVMTL